MSKQLDPSNTTEILGPGQVPDYSNIGGAFTLAALAIAGAIFAVHHYVLAPHKQESAGKFIPVFLNSPKAKMESCKTAVAALDKAVKSPWQIGTPDDELNQAQTNCFHYQLACELQAIDKGEKAPANSCQPRKLTNEDLSALTALKKIPALVPAAEKAGCESAVTAFARQFEIHRTQYKVELRDMRASYAKVGLYCKGKAAQNALDKLDFYH